MPQAGPLAVTALARSPAQSSADAPAVAAGFAGLATVEWRGPVALFSVNLPCPSAWNELEVDWFCSVFSGLEGRPDVTAIVLHGADLFHETDGDEAAHARATVDAVARCAKPVFAAIPGDAVGVGLELALACAGRVAAPACRMRLPALELGRLPVHGAVERLPRLIGMAKTADLLIFGKSSDAAQSLQTGLVDAIDDDVIGRAIELACGAACDTRLRARQETPVSPDELAELFGVRLKVRRLFPDRAAPLAACQALETATLPIRRAIAETTRIAEGLAQSAEARALAHVAACRRTLAAWGGSERSDVLAHRLRWPLLREAVHLLDEGATPPQVDRVLSAYGFAEGPFALSDRLGLREVFLTEGSGEVWLSYSATLDLMLDAHREGGASPGWYRRTEDDPGRLVFDPEVGRLLEASATFQRLLRRAVKDEVILARCLLAAINGAAGLLQSDEEGLTADLVDAIWTERLGFPPWKGGPLHQAHQMGLEQVVADLRALHAQRNTIGAPAAILTRWAARAGASG